MSGKIRLDLLLLNNGLAMSREKARAMVLAGEVLVDGKIIDKPGTNVHETAIVTIKSKIPRYVSRGGIKLEHAIHNWSLDFEGKVVLDIGASTGGYTDCALKHGAQRVYAVDVGYGQLDWSLRNHEKVVNMEKTNIRYVTDEAFPEKFDFILIDVSFISTKKIFPVIYSFLQPEGQIICLIKPQFEAGRELVGKKGVVRDPKVHELVLKNAIEDAKLQSLFVCGITNSPIKGPQGNIEFFIRLTKEENNCFDINDEITSVVTRAHELLNRGSQK